MVTVAVIGEPVSAPEFPVLREFTGNFVSFAENPVVCGLKTQAFLPYFTAISLGERTGK